MSVKASSEARSQRFKSLCDEPRLPLMNEHKTAEEASLLSISQIGPHTALKFLRRWISGSSASQSQPQLIRILSGRTA